MWLLYRIHDYLLLYCFNKLTRLGLRLAEEIYKLITNFAEEPRAKGFPWAIKNRAGAQLVISLTFFTYFLFVCFQLKYQTSLSSIVASCGHVDTIPSRFLKLELDAFWQHLGQHRPDRLDSKDSTAKVLVMLGKVCYEKIQNCFVYTICLWQSLRKRKCNAIVLRSSFDASEPVSLHSFSVVVVTKQNISVALLLCCFL